jgi:hypothetical protein
MSAIDLSPDEQGQALARPVIAVLAAWFALAALAGYSGLLKAAPGALPIPVMLAIVPPVLAFLALYGTSAAFRGFILSLDLRLLTMVHAWRFVGFSFLVLYGYGMLPGLFAWPAGLGDMAVAATAPLVVIALIERPEFGRGRAFVTWHLLGLLDFVVAVATGALTSGAFPGVVGEVIPSTPLVVLPLSLIPSFAVPLFVILHLAALLQARQLARAAAGRA